MGSGQGEEPLLSEESIRPTDVISMTAPETRPFLLLAQQRPQTTTDEAVQSLEL